MVRLRSLEGARRRQAALFQIVGVERGDLTGTVVERLLSSEPMASPGAACLALAWRHRDTLLGQ